MHGHTSSSLTCTLDTSDTVSIRRHTSRFIRKLTSLIEESHAFLSSRLDINTLDSFFIETRLSTEDFTGMHFERLTGSQEVFIDLKNDIRTECSIIDCHSH